MIEAMPLIIVTILCAGLASVSNTSSKEIGTEIGNSLLNSISFVTLTWLVGA